MEYHTLFRVMRSVNQQFGRAIREEDEKKWISEILSFQSDQEKEAYKNRSHLFGGETYTALYEGFIF